MDCGAGALKRKQGSGFSGRGSGNAGVPIFEWFGDLLSRWRWLCRILQPSVSPFFSS